jgi:predicted SprT family Zn-dependent metalloprotease
MQQFIREKVDHYCKLAAVAADLLIEYTDKQSRTAGWYWPGQNKVTFNTNFFEHDEFNETIAHEVAHHIDYVRNNNTVRRHPSGKRDMHGKFFKAIMRELGFENAGAYHSMPHKGKRQRRWGYTCTCGKDWKLTTTLHNKVTKGQVRICTCKATITKDNFVGEIK